MGNSGDAGNSKILNFFTVAARGSLEEVKGVVSKTPPPTTKEEMEYIFENFSEKVTVYRKSSLEIHLFMIDEIVSKGDGRWGFGALKYVDSAVEYGKKLKVIIHVKEKHRLEIDAGLLEIVNFELFSMLELFVKGCKANVQSRDDLGNSLLHVIAKTLPKKRRNVKGDDDGYSKKKRAFVFVINCGADLESKNKYGQKVDDLIFDEDVLAIVRNVRKRRKDGGKMENGSTATSPKKRKLFDSDEEDTESDTDSDDDGDYRIGGGSDPDSDDHSSSEEEESSDDDEYRFDGDKASESTKFIDIRNWPEDNMSVEEKGKHLVEEREKLEKETTELANRRAELTEEETEFRKEKADFETRRSQRNHCYELIFKRLSAIRIPRIEKTNAEAKKKEVQKEEVPKIVENVDAQKKHRMLHYRRGKIDHRSTHVRMASLDEKFRFIQQKKAEEITSEELELIKLKLQKENERILSANPKMVEQKKVEEKKELKEKSLEELRKELEEQNKKYEDDRKKYVESRKKKTDEKESSETFGEEMEKLKKIMEEKNSQYFSTKSNLN